MSGPSSNQQYLYCSSSTPHQLQGIYGPGATCSNPGPADYLSKYDQWGNVSTRTYNNQVATLSYDQLDQMVEWQIPSTNQAWYAYDASGNRSLQRTTSGGTTQITVYAFGVEEYTYDGSGNLTTSTHYYLLGGQLIAELTGPPTGQSTNFFMTDALGSVLATFSNTAGAAAMLGTQLYTPYGGQRYLTGNMGTDKGFTGQYSDPVTGLDYYGSRYYDPVASVFLTADNIEGNVVGMNPYSYVNGNPETYNDPSGEMYAPPRGGGGGGSGSGNGNGNLGDGSDGGSGNGNNNNNNNSGGGCPWYDLGCNAQHIWHQVTQGFQKAVHAVDQDVTHEFQALEQVEQQVASSLIKFIVKVVVAVAIALVAMALAIFAAIHIGGSSKTGGWDEDQQRSNAYQLAQNVDRLRINNNSNAAAPFGQGCIGIGAVSSCQDTSGIVNGFGQSSNSMHVESQLYRWAKGQIQNQYQNLPKGSVINVLIYTQQIPCAKFCQQDIPNWVRMLQSFAPKGVIVNLYVWFQPGFNKNAPLDNPVILPGDVEPYYP